MSQGYASPSPPNKATSNYRQLLPRAVANR